MGIFLKAILFPFKFVSLDGQLLWYVNVILEEHCIFLTCDQILSSKTQI